MADQKISELTDYTPAVDADEVAIVDTTTTTTKKITWANIKATLKTYNDTLYAVTDQTMYIGTTAVAINRGTAALTLAGITLTTPDCGTPSAIVLTNASGTVTNLTLVTPALGTPASGVLTSCTGLPAAAVVAGTFGNGFTITTPILTKPVINATNPSAEVYTPDAAATATMDCSLSNTHRITMPAGNITIAVSNVTNAQKFIIEITQDGTGSRTVTWFAGISWPAATAPTLTTGANKRDWFGFERTGADTYLGCVIAQNL